VTDVGEGVAIFDAAAENEVKCPICGKALHETTTEKKEGKGELKSIPKNLGISSIPQDPKVAFYTTAAHHLIPAIQCLAKFIRLSKMADAVGYDVNAPINGLALPTHGQLNQNSYLLDGVKYGDLNAVNKKAVAFDVMGHLDKNTEDYGSQWHVGHHDWSFETAKSLATDSDDISHGKNYEGEVNQELRFLEKNLAVDSNVCEPEEGEPGDAVISELNELSETIKDGIKNWETYFVSAMSYTYSRER
jgi:hypothetical protein